MEIAKFEPGLEIVDYLDMAGIVDCSGGSGQARVFSKYRPRPEFAANLEPGGVSIEGRWPAPQASPQA